MDSEDSEPQSARSLFEAAEDKRHTIESSYDSKAPTFAADVASAVSLYCQAIDRIASVSLFSPNEGVDDVTTSELPLLLAPFHAAELVQRTPGLATPAERLGILQQARRGYERFLGQAENYGLVPKTPYGRMLERYRDDPEAFAAAAGADAGARRDAKVAAYRAEKQLREKVEALRRNPRYLEHGDEELVRELHLTSIQAAVHATFNGLDSLNREVSLLTQAPPPPPPGQPASSSVDARSRQADQNFDPTLRLDELPRAAGHGGPLLSRDGKPLQPFTLLPSGSGSGPSRADLARGVFRPGHNLPTMSIDEYLDEERRRGNIIEGGGEQPRPQLDEDDMDAVDRETYKARDWDDFTDDNPRGSGNTLNKG
jgi:immunoglobulin-binding protein 1